jgi:hypothetical protein
VSEPLGPVVIGPREIYDAVLRLQGSVDRLGDRHEAMVTSTAETVADLRAELADHETRIRAGERSRWPLPSLAVVVSLVAVVLGVLPLLAGGTRR